MTLTYLVYALSTGHVHYKGFGPQELVAIHDYGSGLEWMQSNDEDPSTVYIELGTYLIKDKTAFLFIISTAQIVADGIDETLISGIPAGTQVQWPDGQTDIVADGEIRFSVDLPGTYTFRFTAVPYLDQEITIEAIAAA